VNNRKLTLFIARVVW